VVIALWSYWYVLFAWNNLRSPIQIRLSTILSVKWMFYFQNSSTEHYQYTNKAAVIKLSFWVRWHVIFFCVLYSRNWRYGMSERGLLEGIGSLYELTSLYLKISLNVTAQAWSRFLHRPSMTSIVSLNLWACFLLDDEGLKWFAERCNKLTYLHV